MEEFNLPTEHAVAMLTAPHAMELLPPIVYPVRLQQTKYYSTRLV
jgi:hypothetical protein